MVEVLGIIDMVLVMAVTIDIVGISDIIVSGGSSSGSGVIVIGMIGVVTIIIVIFVLMIIVNGVIIGVISVSSYCWCCWC